MTSSAPAPAPGAPAAPVLHGEGAEYPNWQWLSPTLSVARFYEVCDIIAKDKDCATLRAYRSNRASLAPDVIEAIAYIENDGFVPSPPERLMSQVDIDGLLFCELPDSMPLEECRRWLSYRLMEYALEETANDEKHGFKPCVEKYLEPTHWNIHQAFWYHFHKEIQKLPGPELEKRAADVWNANPKHKTPYSIRYVENGCPKENPLAMRWNAKAKRGEYLRPNLARRTLYARRLEYVSRLAPEERSKPHWRDWLAEVAPRQPAVAPAATPVRAPEPTPVRAPEPTPATAAPVAAPSPPPIPQPAEPAPTAEPEVPDFPDISVPDLPSIDVDLSLPDVF